MLCEHQRCGAARGKKGEKLEISWPGTAWTLKTFLVFVLFWICSILIETGLRWVDVVLFF